MPCSSDMISQNCNFSRKRTNKQKKNIKYRLYANNTVALLLPFLYHNLFSFSYFLTVNDARHWPERKLRKRTEWNRNWNWRKERKNGDIWFFCCLKPDDDIYDRSWVKLIIIDIKHETVFIRFLMSRSREGDGREREREGTEFERKLIGFVVFLIKILSRQKYWDVMNYEKWNVYSK